MGIVFEISADFRNGMMFYFRSFLAQTFREPCAYHQASTVKREVSSVGTSQVNQKAGSVLSFLAFQFHFFRGNTRLV